MKGDDLILTQYDKLMVMTLFSALVVLIIMFVLTIPAIGMFFDTCFNFNAVTEELFNYTLYPKLDQFYPNAHHGYFQVDNFTTFFFVGLAYMVGYPLLIAMPFVLMCVLLLPAYLYNEVESRVIEMKSKQRDTDYNLMKD